MGQVEPDHYAPVDAGLEQLFAAHAIAEMLREAVARKLLVAPALSLAQIDALDHFATRGFWRELAHPELGLEVRYPGAFARFSASPLAAGRRAPAWTSTEQRSSPRRARHERFAPTRPRAAGRSPA
jgi:crotonobetainyl-CoA:carnitine CoA-transferase CaiB-like acyl-CoA transferase